jgi:hypothetical protein
LSFDASGAATMSFGFFGRKSMHRLKNRRSCRERLHRIFEQLEDRRLLVNNAPNLALINDVSGTSGTEIVVQLDVNDTETPDAELFVFFDPDEMPVTNATIDNATKTIHWTPTQDQVRTEPYRFVVLVTDKPAGGSPALADAEEFLITVAAGNQPPVNTVPGAQTVAEDTDLVFSTANTNPITVADPDAGTADLQVTLSSTNGDLTLGTIAGLTFTGGDGTDDATMTFTGTLAEINAALAGLRFSPQANFNGAATITIVANDQGNTGAGGAKSDTDTINVTVTPVADTPSITAATTPEDTQTTSGLVVSLNAADGDEVTHVKVTNITGGTLFLSNGTTMVENGDFVPADEAIAGFRFTPAENFNGAASFRIQAATSSVDAGLAGDVVTAQITVTPVNDAPDLAPLENRTVRRGQEVAFTATATDIDTGSVLTFSIDPESANLGATIDPVTGEFSWTPSATQPVGPVTLRILVTDNGTPDALADSEEIIINVRPENEAPVFMTIDNQTIAEGSALAVTATATDPDTGDTVTYSLSPEDLPDGVTINAQTGAIAWTPTESQGPGTYTITVIATDNRTPSASGMTTFTVTVTEGNQAPQLTAIGNQTGAVGSPVTFTAAATDPDVPANALVFSVEGAPAGATIDPASGAFSWTPTAEGTFTFTVVVSDDADPALTDEEEITITVAGANQAPVLAEIPAQTATVGQEVSFDANATDADDDTITYTLAPGAPEGAAIDGTTGEFTWTPAAAGTFTVTVIATDNGTPAQFDSQAVTITVTSPNQAPVLEEIPAQTGTVGTEVTFTAAATDPDGGNLTYSLDNRAPTGATINAATGAFSWTPTGAGPVTFGVVVMDDGNPPMSATRDVTITVNAANQAPVLEEIPAQTGVVGTPVTFTATATDPDGDTITYTLSNEAPQDATINAATGEFTWTPTADGVFTFDLVATDNGTPPMFASRQVTITVAANGG